ncbi:methylated-DNA--[protein]-cysteine S-methyltransferase [Pelatocladus sp. BLCC-F211]|uniref:methylated-DNA--[protein]-cysteine S-methyltransferase n=1 Tax=Pelatocladus sp. BLCC-F211 TaxID=3342752 RepID=UPI0035B84655
MKPLIKATAYDNETYERIAKAIAFMYQNHLNQPDLKTIAQHVHLSEYHFQRLFTTWAGISPKRFSQYLTIEYAKSKITETKNLLDLTLEAGLSSPGRLHDLFVKLEAMSPGEFKAGGVGLQIRYGVHESPFGYCLIATTARGICNLYFLDGTDEKAAEHNLRTKWTNAEIIRDQQMTEEISDRIFNPFAAHRSPLVLHVKGTNFQIQVWRALLRIPFAGITTYQGLAASIGRPTAARAIGNAIGSNPVGYLIPCHRVIRESGAMGGYRWGLERKTVILGWEASRNQNLDQDL